MRRENANHIGAVPFPGMGTDVAKDQPRRGAVAIFVGKLRDSNGSATGNQKGFSLVELLVAIMLFSIGIMAIATIQDIAIRENRHANTIASAGAIAQEVMENILSWDSSDARFPSSGSVTANYAQLGSTGNAASVLIPGAGTFTATYTMTANAQLNGAGATIADFTRIDVTVTNGTISYTLTGYKSRS